MSDDQRVERAIRRPLQPQHVDIAAQQPAVNLNLQARLEEDPDAVRRQATRLVQHELVIGRSVPVGARAAVDRRMALPHVRLDRALEAGPGAGEQRRHLLGHDPVAAQEAKPDGALVQSQAQIPLALVESDELGDIGRRYATRGGQVHWFEQAGQRVGGDAMPSRRPLRARCACRLDWLRHRHVLYADWGGRAFPDRQRLTLPKASHERFYGTGACGRTLRRTSTNPTGALARRYERTGATWAAGGGRRLKPRLWACGHETRLRGLRRWEDLASVQRIWLGRGEPAEASFEARLQPPVPRGQCLRILSATQLRG